MLVFVLGILCAYYAARWRVPKDRRPTEFPAEFGVAPVNVLLLYE